MKARSRIERLRSLGDAFAKSDCTKLEFRDGEFEVELVRRGSRTVPVTSDTSPSAGNVAFDVAASGESRPVPSPVEEHIVHADIVGVVRMPKTPLAVGLVFDRDREVASIESLGIRSPIHSGGAGRVVRVLVSDGDAVEYGQALFVVEHV